MQSQPIWFNDTEIAFASRSKQKLKMSYCVFLMMRYPWVVKVGTAFIGFALKIKFPLRKVIKKTLFNQFCGGESIKDCKSTIQLLAQHNVSTILDYSVEGVNNEEGYNESKAEALRVIEYAAKSSSIPFCVLKLSALGPTDIMTKYQNREKLTEKEKTMLDRCEQRVAEIARKVYEKGLRLMLDAEESWFQNFTDEIAERLMEKFNKDRPVVFNTYQLYRHEMFKHLEYALVKAVNSDYYLGVKLVRGAYMEMERKRAKSMDYLSPIHSSKAQVDRDYNKALDLCLSNISQVGLCAGTHNEYSSELLAKKMDQLGLSRNDPRVYFAQLLGMSDHISFKLSHLGYNVAKYVPYGSVEKVMPYLFRRAAENTSMTGHSGRERTLIKQELKRRKRAFSMLHKN